MLRNRTNRISSALVVLVLTVTAHGQWIQWMVAEGGNGHLYQVVTTNQAISWDVADTNANQMGGHLATATTAQENAFIYSLVAATPSAWGPVELGEYGAWLGGFQPLGSQEPGGGWEWVSGEVFVYTNWNTDTEPNDLRGMEDKLHFHAVWAPPETWNDLQTSGEGRVFAFVVEKEDQCSPFGDRQLVLERWAENRWVGTPTVIRDAGEYRMWLRSEFIVGRAGIFTTTSLDGITWASMQTALLPGPGWESIHLYEGAVIKEGSVYKMWYTGYGGANNQIGYATSSDGVNWTKYAGNPVVRLGVWDSRVVRVGSVIFDADEGLYKMWYTGGSGWFHPLQVGIATSPDGITWTKHPSPVFTFGSTTEWIQNHVNVILHNGIYEMYFSSGADAIRKATSINGMDWTVSACAPVLEPATSGWDSGRILSTSVLSEGSIRKLWYDADDGVRSGIGFAQLESPPSCDAGGSYTAECDGDWTSVLLDGSLTSDPDDDPLDFHWSTDCPGGFFDDSTSATPVLTIDTADGCTTTCSVTLWVDDGHGGTSECSTTVTIEDTRPPVVTCAVVSLDNHYVAIEYAASDECGAVTGSAVIETQCCPLPVLDGQVVKIKCKDHEECKLNLGFADGMFKIKTDEAALVVTATDECGNEATCRVELCVPD